MSPPPPTTASTNPATSEEAQSNRTRVMRRGENESARDGAFRDCCAPALLNTNQPIRLSVFIYLHPTSNLLGRNWRFRDRRFFMPFRCGLSTGKESFNHVECDRD